MNSSFIALISKTNNPVKVTNFRLISLINSTLKIILKLLASRLGRVMSNIISEERFLFVKGRKISETVLIVKEVVHSMGVGKVEGLILKIDFEKAFDSVKWSFLLQIFKGFWIRG